MFKKIKNTPGFTLIELLVTISIILIVTGGGIAGFVNFNDRQQVQTTVKQIQDYMRSAQIKARSGEAASDCAPDKLRGYQVALNSPTNTVVLLNRVCENPISGVTTQTERSKFNLNNVTVTLDPVTFLALKGGVDAGGSDVTVIITGQYTGISYQFQVLETGEITEGAFQ